MASGYAFSIDLDRCIGCQACAVACEAGNETRPGDGFIAVTDVVRRQADGLWGSFAHRRCFHCDDAPCVRVCPTGTLSKWNGLTAVAAEKCSGCGYCTDACPFEVPRVRDDQVVKCVGCIERIGDGRPWCEQTCPSQAIQFGERQVVLAEARLRAERLRARYPEAQVYGETQLGGLGLLLVLLDRPGRYGLPEKPETPAAVKVWKEAVQPAATGLSAAAAVTMGLLFVVARRRHAREKAERQASDDAVPGSPPEKTGEGPGPGHD
jgi:formate dehydrogenase iron-sulfur subunit